MVAKAQVFEQPFQLPHAQTVGQRRKNIQGFFGNFALQIAVGDAGHKMHGAGAHRQFNQHHTDVRHHRNQHFAHGFGLLLVLFRRVDFFDAGEFGQLLHLVYAFDQARDAGIAVLGGEFLPIFAIHRQGRQNGGGQSIGKNVQFVHEIGGTQHMRQHGLAHLGFRVFGVIGLRQL